MYMITKRQVHGKEYVKRLAIIYNGVQRTTFSYRLHFAAFSCLLRRCSVFCWRCFVEMTPALFALWYGFQEEVFLNPIWLTPYPQEGAIYLPRALPDLE